MKKNILSVLAATLWISLSEFLRNTFLLHTHWVKHYEKMGITFPEEPLNGAVWGIWSLCLAIVIFQLSRTLRFWHTTLLAWFTSFAMMWVVAGNLGFLPYSILPIAVPLSLLEVGLAAWMIYKIKNNKQ